MAYWIIAAALIVFGFLGSFTIGQPFLLVGLAMVVLGPFRGRPMVFWPLLLGVIASVATFMAIAPFMCTGTVVGDATPTTVCTSLIGIRYETEGFANPALLPGALTGLAVGVVTAVVTLAVLWRRTRSASPPPGP